MARKFVHVLAETSQDAMAILLRMYGFEGLLRRLRPPADIDERIAKLVQVQKDLEAVIEAVRVLRQNADNSKQEAEQLQTAVAKLQEDKKAAEDLMKLPEEAVARLLYRANAKARGRGLIEGVCIGLVTGLLSSLLAWYITRK